MNFPDQKSVVFMYHNIAAETPEIDFPEWEAAYDVTLDNFLRHMQRMETDSSNGASIHVTFDDGYRSFYEHVLSRILPSSQVQFTCFITTSAIGKKGMLDAGEIRKLHENGVQIGAHSHSHVFLENLLEGSLQDELFLPKVKLEDAIGAEVASFSLPGGRYDERAIVAAQKFGYREIYTSLPGYCPLNFRGCDEVKLFPRWLVEGKTTSLEIEKILNYEKNYVFRKKCRYFFGKTAKHVLGNNFYHTLWRKAAKS